MACRRLLQQGQVLLRRAAANDLSGQRPVAFSTLPEDLQAAVSRARYPVRRSLPSAAAEGATEEMAGVSPQAAAAVQQAAGKNVQVGSPWMFPWERRQLQGGELRWWEKMYWGVFVVGIALILFNRIEWEKAPDPAIEERRLLLEKQRLEAARMVLAGKSILVPWGSDDPFGGMSPEEIEEFCKTASGGASEADPFEGLSPEEIDEYIEKHVVPGSQS